MMTGPGTNTYLVGGDELARGEVTVRDMATGDQQAVARPAIVEEVRSLASKWGTS